MRKNRTTKSVLIEEGFEHTTVDMWRGFCRHVVDIENNYFEKDRLIEDRVEEMSIQSGDNDKYESDDDLINAYDRQIIDDALQRAPEPTDSTNSTEICSDPRELTSTIQSNMDQELLTRILPLT